MIELEIPINVPENRQVTLTLPPEVLTGPAKLRVAVDQGESAKEFVVTFPFDSVPREFPTRPIHPELAREFDEFQAMLPELLKTHRGKYVAMWHGKIVASGDNESLVRAAADRNHGATWAYVALVTDQPQPIERIRSPREVRP